MDYKNFYVLGDSLSDCGVLVGVLSRLWIKKISFPPPFFEGRSFCNGPLAVECVAERLKLPSKPGWRCQTFYKTSEQVGTNYAVSNARAAAGKEAIYHFFFNQFQLKHQLNALMKHHPDVGRKDLFLIMIGGNDVITAIDEEAPEDVIKEAIEEIHKAMSALAAKDVERIIVANVPDLGRIPEYLRSKKQVLATQLTLRFNQELKSAMDAFARQHPVVELKLLDLASIFDEVINDFDKNGCDTLHACLSDIANHQDLATLLELLFRGTFKAVYNPGCDEKKICEHLFFDYFHATRTPQKILGDRLYELIMT